MSLDRGNSDRPLEECLFLTAEDLRAVDRLAREREDSHFLQTVRSVEMQMRRTVSTSTDTHTVFEVLPFSFTTFTTDFDAFMRRVIEHLRAQGFVSYRIRGSTCVFVSWARPGEVASAGLRFPQALPAAAPWSSRRTAGPARGRARARRKYG